MRLVAQLNCGELMALCKLVVDSRRARAGRFDNGLGGVSNTTGDDVIGLKVSRAPQAAASMHPVSRIIHGGGTVSAALGLSLKVESNEIGGGSWFKPPRERTGLLNGQLQLY